MLRRPVATSESLTDEVTWGHVTDYKQPEQHILVFGGKRHVKSCCFASEVAFVGVCVLIFGYVVDSIINVHS